MKSKEVLKILKITRPTLCKYVRTGKIKGKLLVNGFYDYDKESVYKLFDKDIERVNVIYCRVSTSKQKQDLENQIETVNSFCMNNGIKISDIYKDVGSGINFDRKEFTRLLQNVINHKIDKIFINYKDRLCRLSFDLFKNLFKEFGCEIVVLNEIDNDKLIEKEIFNEIIGLIHDFGTKIYSNRRKEKLKLVEKDLKLDEDYEEEKCN